MSATPLGRGRTPDRPGPGPLPEAFLRAVDLQIGRRLDGLLDRRAPHRGSGHGDRAGFRVREWGRVTMSGASTGTRRRARTKCRCGSMSRSARSRRGSCSTSPVDALRDRRPKWDVAEEGRDRAPGFAPGEPDRRGHLRRGRVARAASPPGPSRAARGPPRRTSRARDRAGRRDVDRERSHADRQDRSPAFAGVVVSDFRGPPDWRSPLLEIARGTLLSRSSSGSEGAVAAEHRTRLARRSGDGAEAARRHLPPPAARALRRSSGEGSRRPCLRALASLGVPHLTLSTEGDWLRPFAAFVERAEAAMTSAPPDPAGGLALRPRCPPRVLARAASADQVRSPFHEPRPAREHRRRFAWPPTARAGGPGTRRAGRAPRRRCEAPGRRGRARAKRRQSSSQWTAPLR